MSKKNNISTIVEKGNEFLDNIGIEYVKSRSKKHNIFIIRNPKDNKKVYVHLRKFQTAPNSNKKIHNHELLRCKFEGKEKWYNYTIHKFRQNFDPNYNHLEIYNITDEVSCENCKFEMDKQTGHEDCYVCIENGKSNFKRKDNHTSFIEI